MQLFRQPGDETKDSRRLSRRRAEIPRRDLPTGLDAVETESIRTTAPAFRTLPVTKLSTFQRSGRADAGPSRRSGPLEARVPRSPRRTRRNPSRGASGASASRAATISAIPCSSRQLRLPGGVFQRKDREGVQRWLLSRDGGRALRAAVSAIRPRRDRAIPGSPPRRRSPRVSGDPDDRSGMVEILDELPGAIR